MVRENDGAGFWVCFVTLLVWRLNGVVQNTWLARTTRELIVATVTKADLAVLINERVGLSRQESREMVDAIFDVMRSALVGGNGVKLSGFGSFELRDKRERPGRNPKTGEVVPITARRVVAFNATRRLRDIVDAAHGLPG